MPRTVSRQGIADDSQNVPAGVWTRRLTLATVGAIALAMLVATAG